MVLGNLVSKGLSMAKAASSVATTKRHVESRLLQTDPQRLFRIILDVDSYHEFLPLCFHSKVLTPKKEKEKNEMTSTTTTKYYNYKYNTFDASLKVGLGGPLVADYVSRVRFNPKTLIVKTSSTRKTPMFDSLTSQWKLRPVEDCINDNDNSYNNNDDDNSDQRRRLLCHVDFEVEMTVSDPVVSMTLEQVLEQVAAKQVEAFEQRCIDLRRFDNHHTRYDDMVASS